MTNSKDETDRANEQRRTKLVKAGVAVLYASQVKKKPR